MDPIIVDFSVVKQKLIKTDEILKMYSENGNKLKKALQTCKALKQKLERTQLENDRCTFSLETLKSKYNTLDVQHKSLYEQKISLEQKYNQQAVVTQENIRDLEMEVQYLKELKKFTEPPQQKNTVGKKKLDELEEKLSKHKDIKIQLETENNKLRSENVALHKQISINKEQQKRIIDEFKEEKAKLIEDLHFEMKEKIKYYTKLCYDKTEEINRLKCKETVSGNSKNHNSHNMLLTAQINIYPVKTHSIAIQTDKIPEPSMIRKDLCTEKNVDSVEVKESLSDIFNEMIYFPRLLSPLRSPSPLINLFDSYNEPIQSDSPILEDDINITNVDLSKNSSPPKVEPNNIENTYTPPIKNMLITRKYRRSKYLEKQQRIMRKKHTSLKRRRPLKCQDNVLRALQILKRSKINFTISNESTIPIRCEDYNTQIQTNISQSLKTLLNMRLLRLFNVKKESMSPLPSQMEIKNETRSLSPSEGLQNQLKSELTTHNILDKLAELVSEKIQNGFSKSSEHLTTTENLEYQSEIDRDLEHLFENCNNTTIEESPCSDINICEDTIKLYAGKTDLDVTKNPVDSVNKVNITEVPLPQNQIETSSTSIKESNDVIHVIASHILTADKSLLQNIDEVNNCEAFPNSFVNVVEHVTNKDERKTNSEKLSESKDDDIGVNKCLGHSSVTYQLDDSSPSLLKIGLSRTELSFLKDNKSDQDVSKFVGDSNAMNKDVDSSKSLVNTALSITESNKTNQDEAEISLELTLKNNNEELDATTVEKHCVLDNKEEVNDGLDDYSSETCSRDKDFQVSIELASNIYVGEDPKSADEENMTDKKDMHNEIHVNIDTDEKELLPSPINNKFVNLPLDKTDCHESVSDIAKGTFQNSYKNDINKSTIENENTTDSEPEQVLSPTQILKYFKLPPACLSPLNSRSSPTNNKKRQIKKTFQKEPKSNYSKSKDIKNSIKNSFKNLNIAQIISSEMENRDSNKTFSNNLDSPASPTSYCINSLLKDENKLSNELDSFINTFQSNKSFSELNPVRNLSNYFEYQTTNSENPSDNEDGDENTTTSAVNGSVSLLHDYLLRHTSSVSQNNNFGTDSNKSEIIQTNNSEMVDETILIPNNSETDSPLSQSTTSLEVESNDSSLVEDFKMSYRTELPDNKQQNEEKILVQNSFKSVPVQLYNFGSIQSFKDTLEFPEELTKINCSQSSENKNRLLNMEPMQSTLSPASYSEPNGLTSPVPTCQVSSTPMAASVPICSISSMPSCSVSPSSKYSDCPFSPAMNGLTSVPTCRISPTSIAAPVPNCPFYSKPRCPKSPASNYSESPTSPVPSCPASPAPSCSSSAGLRENDNLSLERVEDISCTNDFDKYEIKNPIPLSNETDLLEKIENAEPTALRMTDLIITSPTPECLRDESVLTEIIPEHQSEIDKNLEHLFENCNNTTIEESPCSDIKICEDTKKLYAGKTDLDVTKNPVDSVNKVNISEAALPQNQIETGSTSTKESNNVIHVIASHILSADKSLLQNIDEVNNCEAFPNSLVNAVEHVTNKDGTKTNSEKFSESKDDDIGVNKCLGHSSVTYQLDDSSPSLLKIGSYHTELPNNKQQNEEKSSAHSVTSPPSTLICHDGLTSPVPTCLVSPTPLAASVPICSVSSMSSCSVSSASNYSDCPTSPALNGLTSPVPTCQISPTSIAAPVPNCSAYSKPRCSKSPAYNYSESPTSPVPSCPASPAPSCSSSAGLRENDNLSLKIIPLERVGDISCTNDFDKYEIKNPIPVSNETDLLKKIENVEPSALRMTDLIIRSPTPECLRDETEIIPPEKSENKNLGVNFIKLAALKRKRTRSRISSDSEDTEFKQLRQRMVTRKLAAEQHKTKNKNNSIESKNLSLKSCCNICLKEHLNKRNHSSGDSCDSDNPITTTRKKRIRKSSCSDSDNMPTIKSPEKLNPTNINQLGTRSARIKEMQSKSASNNTDSTPLLSPNLGMVKRGRGRPRKYPKVDSETLLKACEKRIVGNTQSHKKEKHLNVVLGQINTNNINASEGDFDNMDDIGQTDKLAKSEIHDSLEMQIHPTKNSEKLVIKRLPVKRTKLQSQIMRQMKERQKMFRQAPACSSLINTIDCDVRIKEKPDMSLPKDQLKTPIITNVHPNNTTKKIKVVQNILIRPNCSNPIDLLKVGSTECQIYSQKKLKPVIACKKKRPAVKKEGNCDVLSKILSEMGKVKSKKGVKSTVIKDIPTGINEKQWRTKILDIAEVVYNTDVDMKHIYGPKPCKKLRVGILKNDSILPKKTGILLKKLLATPNEDDIPEGIMLEFKRLTVDEIIDIIIYQVSRDIHDKPDIKYYPAPLMTRTQRLFLCLLVRLEKERAFENILEAFFSRIQEHVLRMGCAIRKAIPLTRLFLSLCRLHADIHRIRTFCCEAFFYAGDMAIPIFFTVLTSWSEVFPFEADVKNYPIAKVLVQLVHLKTCSKQGYNLLPLKGLLSQYYGYPKERWDCDKLFEEVYQGYLANPSIPTDYAVRLFCKNKDTKWVYKKVNEYFKPLIYKIPVENVNFKATTIILMGKICRLFKPNNSHDNKCLIELLRWFEGLLEDNPAPILQQSIQYTIELLPNKDKKIQRYFEKEPVTSVQIKQENCK